MMDYYLNEDINNNDELTEIDVFAGVNESHEERQRRKARLDALEERRTNKSLREQIDYLYDKEFIRVSPSKKKGNSKDFY